jgi:hypothetical protein
VVVVKVRGGLQRSIVECDIIEGWALDEETADLVPDIRARFQASGGRELLIANVEARAALLDLCNGFHDRNERGLLEASQRLLDQSFRP